MLSVVAQKIREHGVLWCIKRAIREFWHPRFKAIQRIEPLNLAIYWPFAQVARMFDRFCALGMSDVKQTVYVFYDLEVSPITYDYCWALALGELKRRESGLEHVHIVLVPGNNDGLRKEEKSYEKIITQDSRKWRIYNMLLPMVDFLPHTSGFTYCVSRQQARIISAKAKNFVPSMYSEALPNTTTFKQQIAEGKDLRCFSATSQGLVHIDEWLNKFVVDRKVITITIREYDYMPARNSNISEWQKFAAGLDRSKYAVVLVPDTNKAWVESDHGFVDCYSFIPATWNIHLRMALYERAYLNLGINSGPLSLCSLTKRCNHIMFRMLTHGVSQSSPEFMSWLGFKIGESLPFAGPTQKWVWEDDTCEIIQREFDLMCDKLS
jgi:hypothetical protein